MRKSVKRLIIVLLAGLAGAACRQAAANEVEFRFVDLAPHHSYTWDGYIPSWEWSPPAGGRQTINDVPFNLAGVIQFLGIAQARRGRSHTMAAQFPATGKFTRAHFLHFTHFEAPIGQPTALVTFRYREGEPFRITLQYGVHFMNWYNHRDGRPSSGATTALVWMAPVPQSPDRRQITGMWHTVFPNPHPDRELAGIEIDSLFGNAGYTLGGITLERNSLTLGSHEQLLDLRPSASGSPLRWSSVRFADEMTGEPLRGGTAAVWLKAGNPLIFWGNHPVGPEGEVKFPLPPGPEFSLELIACGIEHMPSRFSSRPPLGPLSDDVPLLKMRRGKAIGGLVRSDSGEPVAGATLQISGVMPAPSSDFALFRWPEVKTDSRGKWSIGAAPEDFSQLTFSVSHPEFQPAEYEQDEDEPHAVTAMQLLRQEAIMELVRGPDLSGDVRDSAGRAVANARIAYFSGGVKGVQKRTRTDAAGVFHLSNLRSGSCAVIVSAPGHSPTMASHSLDSKQEPLRIELKPAAPLKLKLVDNAGRPVQGAYVMLPEWRGLRWLDWMARSDADGVITWNEAPLEPADYFITSPDVMAKVVELKPGAAHTIEVTRYHRVR